jgi:hypothetical protein
MPGGRCQRCGRPQDRRGRPARWPDLIDAGHFRLTRVVLAAAHLDNNPASNRLANLRSLCQRCHLLQDLPFHRVQRWLTYRRRWAVSDLFLGLYEMQLSLSLFRKPGLMQAAMTTRSGPLDSWRLAQLSMAARMPSPSALELQLRRKGRQPSLCPD